MPIYEYRCLACGEVFEVFQGMGEKDDPLECKRCGSKDIERILSPSAFTFKEGGFSASSEKWAGGGRCCERGVSCANPKRCCERR
ncbi:MAG: zinc ribbon domain-containing protein [Deltaproteobacteria bacterium]|nr:MAG: zinc ribbon domain-containing protein [Deltaproteobacteria bacterium]RLA86718.1 MAG: zinc ribbon domain-containing protein [Deltaproteobacteria bacterium]